MPMPKPKKPEDLNIGANGTTNQEGRRAASLKIKVVKAEQDILMKMAKLVEEKDKPEEG